MALIRFGVEVDRPLATFFHLTGLDETEVPRIIRDSPRLCMKTCVTRENGSDIIDTSRIDMYLATLENAVNKHAERQLERNGFKARDPKIRVVCCFVEDENLSKKARGDGTLQIKFYRCDTLEPEPGSRLIGILNRTETYH